MRRLLATGFMVAAVLVGRQGCSSTAEGVSASVPIRATRSKSVLLSASGSASKKALLKVESVPSHALVTVRETNQTSSRDERAVAGETPFEKELNFGKGRRLWLELEKRGYEPQIVEVTPESRAITVQLSSLQDKDVGDVEQSCPRFDSVLVVPPQVTVIRRGFSKEEASPEQSAATGTALAHALGTFLEDRYTVTLLPSTVESVPLPPRSLWRDARTAMELLDPIRIKYLAVAPALETSGGREAAHQLAESRGAETVLLVYGKQNVETRGMSAGKLALMAAGTAASYGQAYSNALSRGDSLFTYNVYLPTSTQGAVLMALLVDCRSGEILWLNKGVWKAIPVGNVEALKSVVADLLVGLP